MAFKIVALNTSLLRNIQSEGLDANGQVAEQSISDGDGNPCRHCLGEIAKNSPMLIFAHRPFESMQPYAEVGPIFICGNNCGRYSSDKLPPLYQQRTMLIRGYSSDERIIYGTGKVVEAINIGEEASRLFSQPDLAFIHVRSSTNNCYHFRLERN